MRRRFQSKHKAKRKKLGTTFDPESIVGKRNRLKVSLDQNKREDYIEAELERGWTSEAYNAPDECSFLLKPHLACSLSSSID
jgi:hypothetical protein